MQFETDFRLHFAPPPTNSPNSKPLVVFAPGFGQHASRFEKVAKLQEYKDYFLAYKVLKHPRLGSDFIPIQRNWIVGDEWFVFNEVVDLVNFHKQPVHVAGLSDGFRPLFRATQIESSQLFASLTCNAGMFQPHLDLKLPILKLHTLTFVNNFDRTPTNPQDFYKWREATPNGKKNNIFYLDNRHQWNELTTINYIRWLYSLPPDGERLPPPDCEPRLSTGKSN